MKKILGLLVCLATAGTAHAVPITYNGYTLDDSSSIVSGNGLEWLQWSETVDISVSDILSELSDNNLIIDGIDYGSGWSIASTFQVVDLFNTFGFGIAPDSWNGTIDQSTSNNDGTDEILSTDPELQFLQLFGRTSYDAETEYEYTAAIFGIPPAGVNNPKYNIASVIDDYLDIKTTGRGTTETVEDGTASLDINNIQDSKSDPLYGIALVRAIPTPAIAAVPEPETMGIMALGLGLLGVSRFRRQSKP